MEPIIYDKCPVCGGKTISEGVDVGVGYRYPPFHCTNCGWSEYCAYEDEESCKNCTEHEKCYGSKIRIKGE